MGAIDGWIKLHRKMLGNPVVCKDSDHLAIWIYLLLNATFESYPAFFKGKKIILEPGQLLTGRRSIAEKLGINEFKVQRVLDLLKSEQQITQQTSNRNRLITILKWDEYQSNEQQNAQPMHNQCTPDAQPVHTNKNVKKDKNVKNNNKPPYPLTEFSFSPTMEEQIHIWLKYKSEKKDKYTESGFKTLLGKMKRHIDQYGEKAVMDLIEESMSNNWKGIIWDRIKPKDKSKEPEDVYAKIAKEIQNGRNASVEDYENNTVYISGLLQDGE